MPGQLSAVPGWPGAAPGAGSLAATLSPRSSGERATASGAVSAGSNPAGGTLPGARFRGLNSNTLAILRRSAARPVACGDADLGPYRGAGSGKESWLMTVALNGAASSSSSGAYAPVAAASLMWASLVLPHARLPCPSACTCQPDDPVNRPAGAAGCNAPRYAVGLGGPVLAVSAARQAAGKAPPTGSSPCSRALESWRARQVAREAVDESCQVGSHPLGLLPQDQVSGVLVDDEP